MEQIDKNSQLNKIQKVKMDWDSGNTSIRKDAKKILSVSNYEKTISETKKDKLICPICKNKVKSKNGKISQHKKKYSSVYNYCGSNANFENDGYCTFTGNVQEYLDGINIKHYRQSVQEYTWTTEILPKELTLKVGDFILYEVTLNSEQYNFYRHFTNKTTLNRTREEIVQDSIEAIKQFPLGEIIELEIKTIDILHGTTVEINGMALLPTMMLKVE